MAINLGKARRARIGVMVLSDEDDWTLQLYPEDGSKWPVGTTAWCRWYDSLGGVIQSLDAIYSADYLTFTMQSDGTPKPADIPDGSAFKIRVSMPGSPTTESTVWRGDVEKE
ncbi:hypothetical protein HOT45_gp25 [Gordonia phage Trine]|uniref:LtfC/p132/Gp6 beta-sandwich domain-containing protein n=1 Tax=Gordonia phage Trine TaxID=2201431 RepID=A0A2Z4Q8Y1_9CAUD|nr:hypothetical protein HOT45_gp25 [Gordonia phage Trine]AWY06527.1 hypothetical protein PBI_TRINE_25 [Gordonia phage Trine]